MRLLAEILLLVFLLVAAASSLAFRSLLAAAATFTIYSFVLALLFASMGAVDVGFTEAVVGAGVVGVLLIATLYRTTRKSRT
jgi:energy-converting hydrogenase B subunit D